MLHFSCKLLWLTYPKIKLHDIFFTILTKEYNALSFPCMFKCWKAWKVSRNLKMEYQKQLDCLLKKILPTQSSGKVFLPLHVKVSHYNECQIVQGTVTFFFCSSVLPRIFSRLLTRSMYAVPCVGKAPLTFGAALLLRPPSILWLTYIVCRAVIGGWDFAPFLQLQGMKQYDLNYFKRIQSTAPVLKSLNKISLKAYVNLFNKQIISLWLY